MEVYYLYISLPLLLLASYLFRRKSSNHPPTVFPTLPIIGHLYLLKPHVYRTLAKLSTKYGPVLLLRLGFRRVLLISSPSAAEECFTKNDIIFLRRKLAQPTPHRFNRDLINSPPQRVSPHTH
ncbi:putative cytochrome P450 [Helianthus anomalus]